MILVSPTAGAPVDPVVARFRALFALLDWSKAPERNSRKPWPGSAPHPVSAYVKALLVKIVQGTGSVTKLRTFLVEHPPLVRELGFRLVEDPSQPYGFDVERTVPGARWLRHQQRTLDATILDDLLAATVAALKTIAPMIGTTVSVDVKHIYSWTRENNPKETIPHRFDPKRQPSGDPDCRLGAKVRGNQEGGIPPQKEFLWGYGTGVATAILPEIGDVVIVEWTQPFNHQDVTWFHPVYERAVATLGAPPTNITADAAFDAWHV